MNSDKCSLCQEGCKHFSPHYLPPLEKSHPASGTSSPEPLPLSCSSSYPLTSHRSPVLSATLSSSLFFSCPCSSPVQMRGHAGQLRTLPESRPGLRMWLVRGAEPVHAEAALPSPGQPVAGVVQHQGQMYKPQDHGCKSWICKKLGYSLSYPSLGFFSWFIFGLVRGRSGLSSAGSGKAPGNFGEEKPWWPSKVGTQLHVSTTQGWAGCRSSHHSQCGCESITQTQSASAIWGTAEHLTCPRGAVKCDVKPLGAAEGETRCSGASQMDGVKVIKWAQLSLETASLASLAEKEMLSDPRVLWAFLTEGQGRGQVVHASRQPDVDKVNVQKKTRLHWLQQSNSLLFAWLTLHAEKNPHRANKALYRCQLSLSEGSRRRQDQAWTKWSLELPY